VWHYINVKPELAYKRSKELFHDLKTALKAEPIDVKAGKNIIEVKPNGVSKGRIVEELLREFSADSVVCIGDDYTDEDMFAALQNTNHAVTIKVGDGETQARYRVAAVPDVIAFLESLTSKSLLPLLTKKLPQIPRKLPALVNKSIKRIRGTKD
jgi:trehalose 6-phosphate synthase/phosphatase